MRFDGQPTEFHGYDTLSLDSRILALYQEGSPVDSIGTGEAAVIVLDRTPFYAESGGQVGDSGELRSNGSVFVVDDTQKIQPDVFGHTGILQSGSLKLGDTVTAQVDAEARSRAACNHSATHFSMLRCARFWARTSRKKARWWMRPGHALTSPTPSLSAQQLQQIEDLVNREIRRNVIVETQLMNYDAAIAHGAMALFGEKYGDQVRVIAMGEFSTELCGGTHVSRSGDIGLFKIVSESGVAAGIRRIEAVTGEGALARVQTASSPLQEAAAMLKAQPQEAARARTGQDNVKSLEKELSALKSKLASSQGDELLTQAVDINGVKVLAAMLEGADSKTLRETLDKLKDKLHSAAIVLAAVSDGKVTLIAGVTADITAKVKAGELVNFVATQVGGKGGGRADMAQAGGTQPENLAAALAGVQGWVKAKL